MKLIDWKKQNKILIRDLSKKIGRHESLLSHYLAGRRNLSPNTAIRIQEATNGEVTVMELLFSDNSKNNLPS